MPQKPHRRTAGRPKKKGIKSKAVLGSTRRLSRFGKEQKRGHRGIATHYTTRTKAIKKLQLSLNDFRRLCVLKGIYPRVPPGKSPQHKGKSKTYYHVKDVSFLAHEPLLEKFRELKVFLNRVKRADGRGQRGEVDRLWSERPTYSLDHLVRERYPSFGDAVRDLDDALCTIYLFAALPAQRSVKANETELCLRLTREWEALMVHTHSVKKVFVSIKGIYYQCEVYGERTTWLVPHRFSQEMPRDVDFKLMGTFVEFYTTMMKFVLFKLYHMRGLQYPPKFDQTLENDGAHLAAVALRSEASGNRVALTGAEAGAPTALNGSKGTNAKESGMHNSASAGESSEQKGNKNSSVREKLESVVANAVMEDGEENDEEAKGGVYGVTGDSTTGGAGTEDTSHHLLFSGLSFFASREVPRESLELCILSLGGRLGWAGEGSPYAEDNQSITHHIVDRPTVKQSFDTREYIQPQWVYDCMNSNFLIPVKRYAVGSTLPPHLSPFVNDNDEGYIPAYREELDRLKAARAGDGSMSEEDSSSSSDSSSDEDSSSENNEIDEEDNIDAGAKGSNKSRVAAAEAEDKERRITMMSKKAKRLYGRMQHGIAVKQSVVDNLRQKRKRIEEEEKSLRKEQNNTSTEHSGEQQPKQKKKKKKKKK